MGGFPSSQMGVSSLSLVANPSLQPSIARFKHHGRHASQATMLLTIPLFAASLLSAASASILEIPDLLAARQTNGTDEGAYLAEVCFPNTTTPVVPPARRSSTFNRPARQMEQ